MHAMSRLPATRHAQSRHEPDLTRIQFDLAYARSWMLLGWTLLKDTAGGLRPVQDSNGTGRSST